MKIMIVSDSHGRNTNLEKALEKVKPIDLFLHLGDFEGSEDYIRSIVPCKIEMVPGNNDYFTGLEKDKIINIGRYTIFLTHGHRYGVNFGTERLKDIAMQYGAGIALFGHTHRPLIDLSSNIWVINPGSITQPRQENGKPSFIIMDLDSNGQAHFTLNYI
ncbi:metallophosphoesterase [Anaerocolumna sp. MB42-C2]|uniref:metallophosphoesterase n=1 Tax=Anaerocolumna sp. MB42-C2 TaxID=3070997 RepID=UPI0027DF1902|nr:metallophosphoesterase [Anaerocolumna sp. MB42-C2]WMJ85912.1 metallophosphoesterase [Anaerocolumna sp. MB42-C2]